MRAKMALIPPISLLDTVSPNEATYFMYLPQLMKSPEYMKWLRLGSAGAKSYTMLDNGAFEGVKTDSQKLVRLATETRVDEVVIPDVLHDMEGTIKLTEEFHHETLQMRITSAVGLKYMAAPQGRTIDECMNCVDEFTRYAFITAIGLPKHLVRTITRTARVQLAAYIRNKYGYRFEVHLLGASPLWPQEIKAARRYGVRGVDTSLPYFFAYYDKDITTPMEEERPPKYFDLPVDAFSDRLSDNIATYREWCND